MFSFHKPRVYRSGSGCCICRAKSSSSRFTDSKRYEQDFYDCFKLDEIRTGEICNACVLLVKRWKKLPRGSERNWQHVVDARAGHGSKPMSKINKVKKAIVKRSKLSSRDNNEFCASGSLYIPKLIRSAMRDTSPSEYVDCLSNGSYDSSLNASPTREESDEAEVHLRSILRKRSMKHVRKGRSKGTPRKSASSKGSFLDLNFWKREKTCCGVIFKGPSGEVLVDRRYLNPCFCRSSATSSPASLSPTQSENPMDLDESRLINGSTKHHSLHDIDTMRMLAATASSLNSLSSSSINSGPTSGDLHSMESFLKEFPGLPRLN